MFFSKSIAIFACTLAIGASAAPTQNERRQNACFIVGTTTLPQEVVDAAKSVQSKVTCGTTKTIGNVPDVSENGVTFSSINFASSKQTPLEFALQKFATASPLASTDLKALETQLDLYLATEAGIRSENGNLKIKVPKFFLAFQAARVKTAQGTAITDPGQTVEHLLGKVTKNAAGESKTLLDQVTALASQLK